MLMVHNFLGLLRLLDLFQELHKLCQASHLWWEVEHLEAKGLQKTKLVVARLKSKDFYEVLKVARTLEPSTYAGPPSSKRCRVPPSTTVSSTRREVPGLEAPSPPAQQPETGNIPTEMAPSFINIGEIQLVYCCWV